MSLVLFYLSVCFMFLHSMICLSVYSQISHVYRLIDVIRDLFHSCSTPVTVYILSVVRSVRYLRSVHSGLFLYCCWLIAANNIIYILRTIKGYLFHRSGTALFVNRTLSLLLWADVLSKNGCDVSIWSHDLQKIHAQQQILG